MMVWMKCFLLALMFEYWSALDFVILVGFGGVALLEKVCHWDDLIPHPVGIVCFMLVVQDVSAQLPAPVPTLPCLMVTDIYLAGTVGVLGR